MPSPVLNPSLNLHNQPYEVGPTIISILQLRKRRHGERGSLLKVIWEVAPGLSRPSERLKLEGLKRPHSGSRGLTGSLNRCPYALPLTWGSHLHVDAAFHDTNVWCLLLSHMLTSIHRASHPWGYLVNQQQLLSLTSKFLPCFLFQSPKRERICLAQLIFLRQTREVTGCSAHRRLGRCLPWSCGWWREKCKAGRCRKHGHRGCTGLQLQSFLSE